ncbi:hypothetical protein Dsin_020436 [Dipteronia sinensis]|uniref:Uncharacterized protein n=1 Tax=Dipteronia sinensis TaxID=43782 RepID=A0AAE0A9G4_9ROSI|nr:hypothetical protein Dsin_020436 [Dipteronia sinensis]
MKLPWLLQLLARVQNVLSYSKVKAAKLILNRGVLAKKNEISGIKDLEDKLAEVERKAVSEGWLTSLREERLKLIADLWKGLRLEEQKWWQKSRVKWLVEGDKNTRFFHNVSNTRRRNNFIGNILFNGVVHSAPTQVKEGVFNFFKDHFKNVTWSRPKVGGLDIKRISVEDRKALGRDFNLEEVWETLSSSDRIKAPGLAGLNLNFIKAKWEDINPGELYEFH